MNIEEHKKALNSVPLPELRERYAQCYGHVPTTRSRSHMINRILWAVQRDALGDISEAARKKALAIADDRDVKERFPQVQRPASKTGSDATRVLTYQPEQQLLPGMVLHRNYQGTDIRLLVLEDGFEWEGKRFKSLSAAARAITGTRWNGKLFFGLKKGGN